MEVLPQLRGHRLGKITAHDTYIWLFYEKKKQTYRHSFGFKHVKAFYSPGAAAKSVVYFQCSTKEDEKVEFLRKNDGTPSVYYFIYNTPLACEGVESVPCTV